jgi:adenine-specific DNA methylase
LKTFQFYIKKRWFDNKDLKVADTFYFLTNLASSNTASGIVLTLYTYNKLDFYYTNKNSINALPSLYDEVDEKYIQSVLNDELKHLFIDLFFEGINKCLSR